MKTILMLTLVTLAVGCTHKPESRTPAGSESICSGSSTNKPSCCYHEEGCSSTKSSQQNETITFTRAQWLSLSCLSEAQKQNYYYHMLAFGTNAETIQGQLKKFDQDCQESKK